MPRRGSRGRGIGWQEVARQAAARLAPMRRAPVSTWLRRRIEPLQHPWSAATAAGSNMEGDAPAPRLGTTFDYTWRGDVAFADVLLPEDAPSEWQDRSELWNAVERSSLGGRGARRGEVALCREANFALPRELSLDDRIELAHEYARSFAREGMCVDLAIHLGHGINPHAHMMLTLAPCDESGFLPRSCTEYL